MKNLLPIFSALSLAFVVSSAVAGDSPQERRHELMEDAKEAAKPVALMLRGEKEFDAAVVMTSFESWKNVSSQFGELFPEGSETGFDTEARETIWTDREGFDAVLVSWSDAIDAAIAAEPQDLEALKPVAGAIFKQCKACHDDYRIEKED
jgi:cytochrome c556